VLAGQLRPLGPIGEASGIFKTTLLGPVDIEKGGIIGDEQGDKKYHGGPEKAIHHYAMDHYVTWKAELRDRAQCFVKLGAFGENLSTLGMHEGNVCVGDVYQVGTVRLQVSQARQPCWKLNVRFDTPDMAYRVQSTGRTGWYYRVLESGKVQAGDELALLERPNANWPLNKLLHYLYVDRLNREALLQISQMPFLTESWCRLASRRLNHSAVEDWSKRLRVPSDGEQLEGANSIEDRRT
jgi:MOSC domain-containing protein YiiM